MSTTQNWLALLSLTATGAILAVSTGLTVAEVLISILLLAGVLAAVAGKVTLDDVRYFDGQGCLPHVVAAPRRQARRRAYRWFTAAALCWLPVVLFWLRG
jgi:hypothetical protein